MIGKAWYIAAALASTAGLAVAGFAGSTRPITPSKAIVPPASGKRLLPAPRPLPAGIAPMPVTYDFSAVDAAFLGNANIVNGALIIGTADGTIHEVVKGNFNSDLAYPIASSSKWLTAALVMRMAQAGKLSLADNPYPRLSYWSSSPSDPRSAVTLQQTLSLTSGFNATPVDVSCNNSPYQTLQACAQAIYNKNVSTTPGSTFSYGPDHLEIAAAIAAVAGAKSFDQLFAEYVSTPLGMNCTRYVESVLTAPLHLNGRACNYAYPNNVNTWAAGGAVSSAHDYAKLLKAFLAGGFITDMNGFLQPRTLGLASGYIPAGTGGDDWKYALGSWNECDSTTWVQSCADDKINSAPGAYGWLPWIDRKHGYYGLIATRIQVGEGDTKAIPVEQTLQPLIVTALGQ